MATIKAIPPGRRKWTLGLLGLLGFVGLNLKGMKEKISRNVRIP
jgi:hypothetical protein